MSERKIRWTARTVLLGVPITLLIGLSQVPVHWGRGKHNNAFWPFGHVHNVAEAIGQCAFWPAVFILLLTVMPWIVYSLFVAAFGNHRNLKSWRGFWGNDPGGW